eukprot:gene36662-44475_t
MLILEFYVSKNLKFGNLAKVEVANAKPTFLNNSSQSFAERVDKTESYLDIGGDDSSDDGRGGAFRGGSSGVKAKQPGQSGWVPAIEDPNYFEDLPPEEIYDSFHSIKRMGFLANRIIRRLNETKHIVTSKILERRKRLKSLQRKQFEQLSPAGVEYLKVLLKMEVAAIKNNALTVETSLSLVPNVKARLGHLALDGHAAEILRKIYATNSSVRTLELWKHLADDYINNAHWVPRRVVDDRLYDVDPGYAPDEKFTPENLRSVFSRLRIEFTKAMLKIATPRSILPISSAGFAVPLLPVASGEQDGEFWERCAKHDKGLFYLYLLFKPMLLGEGALAGTAWHECLMLDMALARTDYESDLAIYASVAPGAKRDHSTMLSTDGGEGGGEYMMNEEGAVHVQQDEEAWMAAVKKNRAIAMYYRRMSMNTDVQFYLDLLDKESTSEALKRSVRNKMNLLLLKKVEDRYDDLNFNSNM